VEAEEYRRPDRGRIINHVATAASAVERSAASTRTAGL
jgi:hypothetical protein